jgi:hypothetical protein
MGIGRLSAASFRPVDGGIDPAAFAYCNTTGRGGYPASLCPFGDIAPIAHVALHGGKQFRPIVGTPDQARLKLRDTRFPFS